MTKKMTRKEALQTAKEIMTEYLHVSFGEDDFSAEHTERAIACIDNMLAQIDKQASRPKAKTQARIENERLAKELIKTLSKVTEPVNAKWVTYNVKYIIHTQKVVPVANIGEEWGAIRKVSIKNRTYYEFNPDFTIPENW